MVQKETQPLPKPISRQLLMASAVTLAVAAAGTGSVLVYSFLQNRATTTQSLAQAPVETTPVLSKVAALGRLEPEGGITEISAPAPNSGDGAVVKEVLVKKGDRVRAGQLVAILNNRDQRQATLDQAKAEVEIAKANLARVKAGARAGDINAQKATITRLAAELRGQIASQRARITALKAEVRNAEVDYGRYEYLQQEGAISASELDQRRLKVDTSREQLKEAQAALERTIETLEEQQRQAKATLSSIAEVRPVDVQVAQAEVDGAIAAVKRAQANLDLSYIKAPVDGQIIEVITKAGQIQDIDGVPRIAKIAKTEQMSAIAEVYQTDVGKVRIGQEAVITSQAFSEKLRGKVAEIGLQVDKQKVFSTNPMANTDNKIVKVKVILNPEDSKKVAAFTNLQVEVLISTGTQ
ncbi:MAG: ABC exporter membrane fusion protein [Symploca sp. SIO2B6]|nr:ABC exporter membrane fusion protein [Symploca sp. SIO2B6]